MPKKLPVKIVPLAPVATRTRLKLGTPMPKCPPIQYPNSWPLLHKAIFYSKLQSSENERKQRNTGAERSKKESLKTHEKLRRYVPHIEPGRRRARQRVSAGKKIRGSFVDFVTFKSTKGNNSSRRSRSKYTKGRKRNKNRSNSKRRSKSKAKSRKTRRVSRRRKQCNRKRGGARPKGRSHSRRRKVSKKHRLNRAGTVSRRRKRRSNDGRDDEGARRALEAAPPCGHAHDSMLKPKSALSTEWFDTGKDEFKDDPLNINDICRNLVKSLPSTPADCREENFDEKNTKPERAAPQRAVYNFKASNVCATGAKSESDGDTPETPKEKESGCDNLKRATCVKELPAFFKDHKSRKVSTRSRGRSNQGRNGVNELRALIEDGTSSEESTRSRSRSHTESTCVKELRALIKDDTSREESTRSRSRSHTESTCVKGHRASIKDDKSHERYTKSRSTSDAMRSKRRRKMQRSKGANQIDYTINEWDANMPAKHKKRNPQSKGESRRKQPVGIHGTGKSKTEQVGGLEPRKMRQEQQGNIITEHRFKLLAQNVRFKRGPQAKRNKAKSRRHPSAKRSRKTTTPRSRQAEDPRRRRPKCTTVPRRRADGNDNDNNNVNNNQTETRIWGRVSGRLLRIGRYLLRKFFFLW